MVRIIKEVRIAITDADLERTRPRFEAKVRKEPNSCWCWMGSKNKDGRGSASIKGLRIYASHLAWMIYRGEEVPKGKSLCHTCDIPTCVNPEHLYVGTQANNMQDVWDRNRRPRLRGSKSPNSRISEQIVSSLREEYVSGKRGRGTRALARKYGISKSQAWNIVSKSQWKDV